MESIIVTGAASGIGRAVCYELSNRNISFIAIDRDKSKLDDLFPERSYECDLSSYLQIQRLFERLHERGVIIGGLIHCAGICKVQDITKITERDIDLTYKVNVFAFIEMFKSLLTYNLRAQDTRVLALSSITANRAYKTQLLYASSKAALESVVKSTAQCGLQYGIKVNAIELGAVKTEMFDSLMPNMDTISKHYPLGILEVSEAAEIIVDLLNPVYSKTSGSVLKIDSGFTVVH